MKIKMTKNLRENLITYGIVVVAFIHCRDHDINR